MGYVNVDSHGGRARIVFEPEMFIFLVLTCLLLLVTFGMWLLVDRRRKRLHNKHVVQSVKVAEC
jgi:flagellar biogenesis protein FliO